MVKCTISCKSYLEVINVLRAIEYNDHIITFYQDDVYTEENGYRDFVIDVLNYAMENPSGFFHPDYPNCMTVNMTPYGMNYMLNNMGIGIRYFVNNRTGDIKSYSLMISFNKPIGLLKRNPIFQKISAMEGFEIEETVKPVRNIKKDS